MTDGTGNPALDHARVLAYDEIEAEQIKESQRNQASAKNSPKFDENGSIVYEGPVPQEGSFERFMGSMGSPHRWAGR